MASHPRPPYTVAPALAASPYHALSVAAYLAANPTITNPLASAAVFSCRRSRADATAAAGANVDPAKEEGEGEGEEGRDDGGTRLLLVQRAPADFLPLRWELPGGSADVGPGGDENLVGAAVRELWEEVSSIVSYCSCLFFFFCFFPLQINLPRFVPLRGLALGEGRGGELLVLVCILMSYHFHQAWYTLLTTGVGIFRGVNSYIRVCVCPEVLVLQLPRPPRLTSRRHHAYVFF